MIKLPTISVILPIYNCELYIKEAVDSVLNQTFTDFELIIIDDCSTDSTLKIIKSYQDSRIKLIEKEKNSGYTDSLNMAIKLAKGEYIARMDGDDICFPNRFESQIEFLQKNKDCALCGTGIKFIGSDKTQFHPSNHDEIKVKLCFSNSFFHPTIMAKKEILLDNLYDKNFEPAEDYDLWTRLIFKVKMSNLPELLLNYRVHENQISNYKNDVQLNASAKSQLKMFQRLFPHEILKPEIVKKAIKNEETNSIIDFEEALSFLNNCIKNNKQIKIYNETLFTNQIQKCRINFIKKFIKNNGFKAGNIVSYIKFCKINDVIKILQ